MRHRIRSLALLAGLGCACFAPVASGQGANAAAAEALFEEARKAMAAADYDTACTRFRESNRLDPAIGTQLNLAACESSRGRVATAWELFSSAAQRLEPTDRRREFADAQAKALAPRLPKLVLKLADGAPAETVVRDGSAEYGAASFGIPLPSDPGTRKLIAVAPGRASREIEVALAEGRQTEVEVAPGDPVPVAPPAAAPGPAASGPPSGARPEEAPSAAGDTRTLGYVTGGVGVAGIITGAVTGAMALGKQSIAEDNCSDERALCSQEGADAADAGRTLAAVSTIGWIVGALGVGAGAYFILSSDSSGSQTALSTRVRPGEARITLVRRW